MKFSGRTNIQADMDATFAAFTDFESFERQALRSGAKIARTDDLTAPGAGMMWDVALEFRGKARKIALELVDYDPAHTLDFEADADGFDATIEVSFSQNPDGRTCVDVTFDVRARSLASKLALQTARLTKTTLNKRFNRRLHKFGKEMEARINVA